jgi:molybdate transport system regulatory protein
MQDALTVRFRVDIGRHCSIGIGKIELLEGIALTGSLSQAARRMRMSYRRAWLLLADLNKGFDRPVVHSSTGGRGGGGAVLTPLGVRLVAGYRKLEAKVLPLANSCLREAGRRAVTSRCVKVIHPTSLRRRTAAQ